MAIVITNEAEFISYAKLMLGNPVINVEIDDSQYSQVIYDSVQLFHRYSYGEGNVKDVLALPLVSGTSAYQLPDNIDSVIDFLMSNQQGSINTLFTPQHNLLYNDWINGNYPGGGGSTGQAGLGGAMVMGNFYITMTYLKEIEEVFGRKYYCDLDPNTKIVRVYPTPLENTVGLMIVWKKADAINLYNHPLVKRLVLAKLKQLWGNHLKKYTMTLPGGGTMTGNELTQEGRDDEKEVMSDIKSETEPPIFMVG